MTTTTHHAIAWWTATIPGTLLALTLPLIAHRQHAAQRSQRLRNRITTYTNAAPHSLTLGDYVRATTTHRETR